MNEHRNTYKRLPVRRVDYIAAVTADADDVRLCGACSHCSTLSYCSLTDIWLTMTGTYPNSRYVRSAACIASTEEPDTQETP